MSQPPVSDVLLLALLLASAGCVSEATAPQAGGSLTRVVPVVVPDVWCPANRAPEDTLQVNNLPACHTTVTAPPPPAPQDSTTWQLNPGASTRRSPRIVVDSTLAASDTTK
jgi:hypothetical protein